MTMQQHEEALKLEFKFRPEMRIDDISVEDVDVDRVDYEMHINKDNEAIEEAGSRIL